MNLSEHFSLEEFVVSNTAVRAGVDNTPSPQIVENLKILAKGLEDVRHVLGDKPIRITSGYRCARLNALVGGSKTSDHMLGLAADIQCPEFGTPLEVCRAIAAAGNIGFHQVIHEYGAWCHVSFPKTEDAPTRELLTIFSAQKGYELGLLSA
jgi:zinc D-Ala-D-Ala carboxypeptidase